MRISDWSSDVCSSDLRFCLGTMFCFDFHHAGDRRRGIAGSAEERGATHKGRAEGTEHARLLGASIETNDSLLELEQHFFLLMILSAFHQEDCLLSKRKARLA